MLSRKYRFHSRGGVNYVYRHGKTVHTSNMTLVFMPNQRKMRRFAVVVSKKVLKSAVGRNRIRRRIYEAIRLENPDCLPPMDGIFTVHNTSFLKMPFRELQTTIHELLERSLDSMV